jgi:lipoprotein-releasing system ATP-binding protein
MTVNAVATNTIIASDVVVDYPTFAGPVRALDHTTVSVEGGTSLAILGPSGCGKSTLLGLLAGLAVPTRGSITIGDVTVSALSERERVRFRRRALGMVYQADNLLPHLTVEENVGLQLAICRREMTGVRVSDPATVLARLGIGGLAKRTPDQLSGGERHRAAVARAIVHRPAVILADEPTGSLDADSAHVVIELLMEVQREIGASLVIVTHNPDIARRMHKTMHLARPAVASETAHAR